MRAKNILVSGLILTNLLIINHTIAMQAETNEEDGQRKNTRSLFRGNEEDLESIGKNYLTFVVTIVNRDIPAIQHEIDELFANECQKIENGNVLFTESRKLSDQLADARRVVGNNVQLETICIIPSSEKKACTVQFKWWTETMPAQITMAILFVNSMGKIFKISEVFNKFQTETLGSQADKP